MPSSKKKSQPGRPTKLNEKTVNLLEACLQSGWSISQACYAAKISRETYYKWCQINAKFSDRMTAAPNYITQIAKKNILKAVTDGDIRTSIWVIDKYSSDSFNLVEEDSGVVLPDGEMPDWFKDMVTFEAERKIYADKYGRDPKEEERLARESPGNFSIYQSEDRRKELNI